jgi:hypothetical protein
MSARERTKLAKGFIINKMYTLGYMGGKHTSPDNLPKSCPPELEQYVKAAIEELRKERLLLIKPTNYGDQAAAVMAGLGRDYVNAYRRHVNLPETDFNPTKSVKATPLSKEELRKLKIRK